MKKECSRLDGLDGLRGLLAITVMLSHLVGSIIGWDDNRAFIGAYLSVVYFFMMSGFVLSYAHNGEIGIIKYSLTRLARLLPLHIFSTILIVIIFKINLILGGYVPNNDVFSFNTILKNILFFNGIYWKDFYIINSPSWSISIEFWVSLLIPLVFNKMSLIIKLLCISIGIGYIWVVYEHGFQQSILIAMISMLIGSLCFDLTKNEHLLSILKEYNSNIFIFISFLVILIGIYLENHSRRDILYMIMFIPLLFIDFTNEKFILKNILSSKIFIFLGFISFPLYLLHELVIVSGVIFTRDKNVSLLLGALLSISFSYLYARCIDLKLYKYLKIRINKIFE